MRLPCAQGRRSDGQRLFQALPVVIQEQRVCEAPTQAGAAEQRQGQQGQPSPVPQVQLPQSAQLGKRCGAVGPHVVPSLHRQRRQAAGQAGDAAEAIVCEVGAACRAAGRGRRGRRTKVAKSVAERQVRCCKMFFRVPDLVPGGGFRAHAAMLVGPLALTRDVQALQAGQLRKELLESVIRGEGASQAQASEAAGRAANVKGLLGQAGCRRRWAGGQTWLAAALFFLYLAFFPVWVADTAQKQK